MTKQLSRQQKRALARELAKGTDIREQVRSVCHQATAKAFDITAEERRAALKEKQADTIGQMLVLIISFMRIKKGHTGKWLTKFTREFNEFCNDMVLERASVDTLLCVLKDETGVDFEKLFAKIRVEEEARLERRKKEIHYQERGR